MKSANLPSGATRTSEVSLCWVEVISGATGQFEAQPQTCIRVRSTGAATVTLDGLLAMTMMANEIALINVGFGDETDAKKTVTVTIGAAACYVQIGTEVERKYPENN